MGILNWLFGKRDSDWQAATAKQLNYARKLRIAVGPKTSREELSALITAAEKKNPKLVQERSQAIERRRAKEFGPELIAQEKQWNQLADQDKWLAAVYQSGKTVKAELLRINGAYISDSGKLRIETEVGTIDNDKDIGEVVDIGRYVELDPARLLWSQVLDGFDIHDVARFKKALQHVEKMARKHGR